MIFGAGLKIARAYKNNDKEHFKQYSTRFLQLMDHMDALLGTRKDFLLGVWISEARANGIIDKEKNLYEFNARDLVTLWGDKESGLSEYSNRQWAGLIKGYHKPGWALFFGQAEKAMNAGTTFDTEVFDRQVKDWEWEWVNKHDNAYSDSVKGEAVETCTKLFAKYGDIIQRSF